MEKREIKFRCWKDNKMTFFTPDNGAGLMSYPVMQYTGLKDKNGKEIYEGDILKLSTHKYTFTVQWNEGGFEIVNETEHDEKIPLNSIYNLKDNLVYDRNQGTRTFEIIDNIYENPNPILITCSCEQNCGKGLEGEVEGHIETCSCEKCHKVMGKLS